MALKVCLFLRSGSPQNVYLLPQRQDFRLERCPRPKQIRDHPNNEPDKISHPATASPDSRSTASQIEFATGTGLLQGLGYVCSRPSTQNRRAKNVVAQPHSGRPDRATLPLM